MGRMKGLTVLFSLCLGILCLQLGRIQLEKGPEYSALAEERQKILLTGISERGTIYDRYGEALTGREEVRFVFLEKRLEDETSRRLLEDCKAEEVSRESEKYRVFLVREETRQEAYLRRFAGGKSRTEILEELQKRYGVLILKGRERYSEDAASGHLLGGLDGETGKGEAGLEALFEEELSAGNRTYFVVTDSAGYILAGLGVQAEGDPLGSGVVTTLDREMQQAAEEVLRGFGKRSAGEKAAGREGLRATILVSRIGSGEILAWAESPDCSTEEALQKEAEAGELLRLLPEGKNFTFGEKTLNLFPEEGRGSIEEQRVTPLQMLRFLGILGNGGIDRGLSLVRGTLVESQETAAKPEEVCRVMGAAAAEELAAALGLEEAAANSEAASADSEPAGAGSAEGAGKEKSAGTAVLGNWALALIPAEVPEYAVVVLVKDGAEPQDLLCELRTLLF